MRRPWLPAVVVVAAACVAYATTWHNYFVQDDFGVVSLLYPKPAFYFPQWFVSTWMDHIWGYTPDEIRPFPAVTYQLAAIFGPTSTVTNHVMNIAIHAGNGVLVLAIGVEAAALSVPAAALAAVVFVLLPVQAESVAWITGRVDSMPAFFYAASFLAWVRWRAGGRARSYLWSLGLFFVALFSKQNTITLAPALVLWDGIVGGSLLAVRGRQSTGGSSRVARDSWRSADGLGLVAVGRRVWRWALPYLPFVVLTVGYLALRYVLFGEIAREGQLNAQSADFFTAVVARHLRRLVFGTVLGAALDTLTAGTAVSWAALAVTVVAVGLVGLRSSIDRWRAARVALYFGIAWIALGVAPVAVAGYESLRHVYLASIGWAVALGVAFDVLWSARPVRAWRPVAAVAGAAVLAVYSVQLAGEVRTWNLRATVSRLAVADLEREALAAPDGTLVIAGAPKRSWEWAVPFVLQPPYTKVDQTKRVLLVSPWLLHCCRSDWEEYTRRTLQAWAARADRPPIVALYWDERTGDLSKLTDAEEPYLRSFIPVLLGTDNRETFNEAMTDMLRDLVLPHKLRRDP